MGHLSARLSPYFLSCSVVVSSPVSIVAVLVQIDIPVRVFLCELTGKTHRAVRTFKRIRIDGLGPKEFEHSLPFLTCVLRKYYCDPKADRSSESSEGYSGVSRTRVKEL